MRVLVRSASHRSLIERAVVAGVQSIDKGEPWARWTLDDAAPGEDIVILVGTRREAAKFLALLAELPPAVSSRTEGERKGVAAAGAEVGGEA